MKHTQTTLNHAYGMKNGNTVKLLLIEPYLYCFIIERTNKTQIAIMQFPAAVAEWLARRIMLTPR